jgi:ABC-type lipoprotein release transport system permease subunit
MPPAFTFYKYNKLVGLVFGIMILLAILSVLNPAKEEVKDQLINEVSKQDQTGVLNNSYQLSKEVNSLDPKSNTEKNRETFL